MDLEAQEIIMTKIRNLFINKHKGQQVGSHSRLTMQAAVIRKLLLKVPMVEHSQEGQRCSQRRIAAKRHRTIRVQLKQNPNGLISYSPNLKDSNKSLWGKYLSSSKTWFWVQSSTTRSITWPSKLLRQFLHPKSNQHPRIVEVKVS